MRVDAPRVATRKIFGMVLDMDTDISELKKRLRYYPDTGIFVWIDGTPKVQGKTAGSLRAGYVRIKIDGMVHWAHHLALRFSGVDIPAGMQVDHINGKRSDNRLVNLRVVTRVENSRNKTRPKHNRTGYMGISKTQTGYMVRTWIGNKQRFHGSFKNLSEAISARDRAYKELGFHHNHGRNP